MNVTLKLNETVKIAKRENPCDECHYLYFKLWQKNDKSRVYINDYKRRTIGYIDTVSGETIINDNQGNFAQEIECAINGFMAEYVEKETTDMTPEQSEDVSEPETAEATPEQQETSDKEKEEVDFMKKTFYSVEFAVIGGNGTSTMWFDNLDDAKEFAAHDFRDNPVRHTYSKPEKIAEIESIIDDQNTPWWI